MFDLRRQDISAATTNFVLITESIPWAETGKKDFSPGEIEPAYDKYKDSVGERSGNWELGREKNYTFWCLEN